jgi:hypothetical protein
VKSLPQAERVKSDIKRNTASNPRILQNNSKNREKDEVILIVKRYNILTVPAFGCWSLQASLYVLHVLYSVLS